MRSARLSLRGIAGCLGLALTLTACGAIGQESAGSADGGEQAAPSAAASESEGDAQDTAPATAPPQDLQSIGEHPSGENEDSKVVLNSVTVSGGTMTVQFSLENNSSENDIQVADLFANGVQDATSEEYESAEHGSVDGVYVTTGEKKRYLVGRGENGVCACSTGLSDNFVRAGQTEVFSAVFAAPPQDVKTVDVHIPTAGVFTDIPVQ